MRHGEGDRSSRPLFAWILFTLYSAFVLSSAAMPPSRIPDFLFDIPDKVSHFIQYALLFLLSFNAFRRIETGPGRKRAALGAFGYCALIGVVTEWLQTAVPGRSPDFFDFLADVAGAAAAWIFYVRFPIGCPRRPLMNYFDYEYRVRYGDTDKLGISYYANYLVWFEAARTEYFRAIGLLYTECEKKGYFLPVVEAGAKYHTPSNYDDLIVVRTSVNDVGGSTMRFEYKTFKKGNESVKIATGFTRHVFVNREMNPVRVPEEIREKVIEYSLLEKKL